MALSKINKYTIKAIKNLVNQEMKFFMQSETDLKDLTTLKLVQLIQQFLHEVLEVIPPADQLLLDNYDAELFTSGAIPV